jgi:phosphate starvation-inducible PhoH-like protein
VNEAQSVVPEIRQDVTLESNEEAVNLFGKNDRYLRMIEDAFDIRLVPRSNQVLVIGSADQVALVVEALEHLLQIVRRGRRLDPQKVRYVINLLNQGQQPQVDEWVDERVITTHRQKIIRPKNLGQKHYIDAMRQKDIVFGIGPAGTGKTYLAMASAVHALSTDRVARIILTRPAVEAGESLGFLPGDMMEKVNPYLRPLYDALHDMIDPDKVQRFLERGIIEVAPLAFMRGRTLNESFIILDEAQNSTCEQMKMFLTRIGSDSKAVITGDITQIDLPSGRKSGLVEASEILPGIEGIGIIWFSKADVVRHPLVQRIIEAYEQLTPPKNGGTKPDESAEEQTDRFE